MWITKNSDLGFIKILLHYLSLRPLCSSISEDLRSRSASSAASSMGLASIRPTATAVSSAKGVTVSFMLNSRYEYFWVTMGEDG